MENENSPTSCKLRIIRRSSFFGSAASSEINIDGKNVGKLKNSQEMTLKVSPGLHTVSYQARGTRDNVPIICLNSEVILSFATGNFIDTISPLDLPNNSLLLTQYLNELTHQIQMLEYSISNQPSKGLQFLGLILVLIGCYIFLGVNWIFGLFLMGIGLLIMSKDGFEMRPMISAHERSKLMRINAIKLQVQNKLAELSSLSRSTSSQANILLPLSVSPQTIGTTNQLEQDLQKLKSLLDSGLISEAEYQTLRKKALVSILK